MLFSLAMALMVILVAAFWVYQGFFSATLMFFECVIAASVAFSFYEPVHGLWGESLGEGLGHPLALMLLFLITLLVLRLLTDKMIKGNVRVAPVLDKIGGGIGGFFSGMVLIGMALIAVQMLPINSDVFGFERFPVDAHGKVTSKSIYLKPDEFTMGMVNMLSNGRLGEENPLPQAKPNMLVDLYGQRACTQTEDRHVIPRDALTVASYWETHDISTVKQELANNVLARTFEPDQPVAGQKFVVCRVKVSGSASPEGSSDIRFRLPQFRLVGPPPAGSVIPDVYFAAGATDLYTHSEHSYTEMKSGQRARLVRFSPETHFILNSTATKPVRDKDGNYQFEVAFEVPENFKPWYMAFKRGAKADMSTMKMLEAPPKGASTGGSGEQRLAAEAPRIGEAPGGTAHVANVLDARVSDELVVALPADDSIVKKALTRGRFGECHFYVDMGDGKEGVNKLEVPQDKKILQLDASRTEAFSAFGKALNLASNVAGQIMVESADGKQYFAVGRWQAGKVGGKMIFELQYHPETEMPERCLEKATKVRADDLRSTPEKDRKFGYIFLVDPGVTIVRFSSGGMSGSGQQLNIKIED